MNEQEGDAQSPDLRRVCPQCGRMKADQQGCGSNYHNTPIGDSGNPKDKEPDGED